jgi:hypothetical protein
MEPWTRRAPRNERHRYPSRFPSGSFHRNVCRPTDSHPLPERGGPAEGGDPPWRARRRVGIGGAGPCDERSVRSAEQPKPYLSGQRYGCAAGFLKHPAQVT